MMKVRVAAVVAGLLAAIWLASSRPVIAEEKPININTASASELTALKGIGEAKAKAIVEYREKNGPFKSVDDLAEVKGIGPKVLDGIRPQVTVGGAPAAAGAAPAAAAAANPAGPKH
jgi:competence protein ComEA